MNNNSKEFAALMRVHSGLPRQAPGDDRTTAQMIEANPSLKQAKTVLDVGCGPGRSSLVLAKILQTNVIALDFCDEFLAELKTAAEKQGLDKLIEIRQGDMTALNMPPDSLDLIWAEGAIYIAGFDQALKQWRPFLKENGHIVCSELSWLTEKRSKKASQYFASMYPNMRSVLENRKAAERSGYACGYVSVLPESAWWDEYYRPMVLRLDALREESQTDSFLCDAVNGAEQEIDMYRNFSAEYGYVFYVLQKSQFAIEEAQEEDMATVAKVFRHSFRAHLPFLPELHTAEEDYNYLKDVVFPNNTVMVAREKSNHKIVGMIAYDKEMINQFYLLPEYTNLGIGSRMLNLVKEERDSIKLWTFQKNELGKRFYAKHGFDVVKETDGQGNEEKEPDILLQWNK